MMENLMVKEEFIQEDVKGGELYVHNITKPTYKTPSEFTDTQINIITISLSSLTIFIMMSILNIDMIVSILTLPILNRIIKPLLIQEHNKSYTIFYASCIVFMEMVFSVGVNMLY